MPIHLTIERGPHAGVSSVEIRRRARAMMKLLQLQKEELSIVLTDDAQIRILNATYRAKDRPTDVLAFALREGDFAALAGGLLGDVVISVETAARQATAARRDVLAEVTMLLAHGLLHLVGWDHDTDAKDRAMRAETDRLCAASSPPAASQSRERAGRETAYVAREKARGSLSKTAAGRPSRADRGRKTGPR